MKNPVILIREDLNMPKGKVCAQTSHALMKMILNLMYLNDQGKRVIKADKFKQLTTWVDNGMPFDVQHSPDVNAIETAIVDLSSDRYFHIMDQGRTVFNGKSTWTVSMIAPIELAADPKIIKHVDYFGPLKAKQSILVTTRPRRHVLIMAEECARASVQVLLNKIIEKVDGTAVLDLLPDEPMSLWLSGSFGKIVLGTRTSENLEITKEEADDMGVEYHMSSKNGEAIVLAIGPDVPDAMHTLTSSFRPL